MSKMFTLIKVNINHKRKSEKVLLKIVLSRLCGGQCYLHNLMLGASPYFTFVEIIFAIFFNFTVESFVIHFQSHFKISIMKFCQCESWKEMYHEKKVSFKLRSGYIGKFWNIPDKLEWEGRDICKTAAESKRKRIEILSSAHTCSPESTLNMDILKRNQTKLELMSNTCKHIAQVSKL